MRLAVYFHRWDALNFFGIVLAILEGGFPISIGCSYFEGNFFPYWLGGHQCLLVVVLVGLTEKTCLLSTLVEAVDPGDGSWVGNECRLLCLLRGKFAEDVVLGGIVLWTVGILGIGVLEGRCIVLREAVDEWALRGWLSVVCVEGKEAGSDSLWVAWCWLVVAVRLLRGLLTASVVGGEHGGMSQVNIISQI